MICIVKTGTAAIAAAPVFRAVLRNCFKAFFMGTAGRRGSRKGGPRKRGSRKSGGSRKGGPRKGGPRKGGSRKGVSRKSGGSPELSCF